MVRLVADLNIVGIKLGGNLTQTNMVEIDPELRILFKYIVFIISIITEGQGYSTIILYLIETTNPLQRFNYLLACKG